MAEAAGVLATGVGLIRNGVTLAGRVGYGLLPRIAGFGLEGGAYGAAQGAAHPTRVTGGTTLKTLGRAQNSAAL